MCVGNCYKQKRLFHSLCNINYHLLNTTNTHHSEVLWSPLLGKAYIKSHKGGNAETGNKYRVGPL